jgi:hypothetical protein
MRDRSQFEDCDVITLWIPSLQKSEVTLCVACIQAIQRQNGRFVLSFTSSAFVFGSTDLICPASLTLFFQNVVPWFLCTAASGTDIRAVLMQPLRPAVRNTGFPSSSEPWIVIGKIKKNSDSKDGMWSLSGNAKRGTRKN